MIDEAICQKDISRCRVFLQPVDQWIVPILYFAPASDMNGKEIDDPAGDDEQRGNNRG